MVRVEDRFEHPKKCPKPEEIKAGENLVRSSSFKIVNASLKVNLN